MNTIESSILFTRSTDNFLSSVFATGYFLLNCLKAQRIRSVLFFIKNFIALRVSLEFIMTLSPSLSLIDLITLFMKADRVSCRQIRLLWNLVECSCPLDGYVEFLLDHLDDDQPNLVCPGGISRLGMKMRRFSRTRGSSLFSLFITILNIEDSAGLPRVAKFSGT